MKRARLACALSLAALACSASGARAGAWWLAPPHPGTQRVGDWYLGASGFGGVLGFPTLNGQTVFTFPASEPLGVVSTRHKITAAGGGLTFGHVLRDGMLPPWLGARVRIAARESDNLPLRRQRIPTRQYAVRSVEQRRQRLRCAQ